MTPDAFYASLVNLFERHEPQDALRIAAKLTLSLAAELNDEDALSRAVAAAQETPPPPPDFAAMQHYGYYRSSSDYRLRIALNLKRLRIPCTQVPLLEKAQHNTPYRNINSAGLVPALVADGETITQSLAILEYLNVLAPQPNLLPGNAREQARIRAFALIIACDMQPLSNLRVMTALEKIGADSDALTQWRCKWMGEGFAHLEERVQQWRRGKYIFGAQPTLAEVFLIPQLYSARRFDIDLSPYPLLREIETICLAHRAFREAAPDKHAPPSKNKETSDDK